MQKLLDAYDDIAMDSILKLGGNDTSRYMGKEFLYSQIKQNDSLTHVTSLAQFKSDADNTNLKPINAMHQGLIYPLDSTAVDSLNIIAATITPDNNIEVNYKEVFELALKNPTMKDSVYLPSDIKRLRIIAHLCPFTDGNAVYSARVILHAFEPDSNYYNYCEFAKRPDRTSNERLSGNSQNNQIDENNLNNGLPSVFGYKIIPNPNDGNFQLICANNNAVSCSLYDCLGKEIYNQTFKQINGVIPFNFGSLTKGIYHLKIIDTNKVVTFKILIK